MSHNIWIIEVRDDPKDPWESTRFAHFSQAAAEQAVTDSKKWFPRLPREYRIVAYVPGKKGGR